MSWNLSMNMNARKKSHTIQNSDKILYVVLKLIADMYGCFVNVVRTFKKLV